jgi:CHAT domain-containing protein
MPAYPPTLTILMTTLLMTTLTSSIALGLSFLGPALAQGTTSGTHPVPVSPLSTEVDRLFQQGVQQLNANQLQQAADSFQQSLTLAKQTSGGNQADQLLTKLIDLHKSLLSAYSQNKEQPEKALESLRRGLVIARLLKQQPQTSYFVQEEALDILGLTALLNEAGQYQDSIANAEQELAAIQTASEQDFRTVQKAKIQIYLHRTIVVNYMNDLKQPERTIEPLNRMEQLLQSVNDAQFKTEIYNTLSIYYLSLGDWYDNSHQLDQALAAYQKGQQFAQLSNSPATEMQALQKIGINYGKQQEFQKALPFFTQALTVIQRSGDSSNIASALYLLGSAYDDLADYSKALTLYQQALALYQKLQDQSGIAEVLNNMSAVYQAQGDYHQAAQTTEQQLQIYRSLRPRYQKLITRENLDAACMHPTEFADSGDTYFQYICKLPPQSRNSVANLDSLHRVRSQRARILRAEEGRALSNVGLVIANLGDSVRALNYYQQALAIAQDLQDQEQQIRVLNNIATRYSDFGQFSQALATYQQALETATSLNNRQLISLVLNNMGSVYRSQGRYPEALKATQESLALAQQIDDRFAQVNRLSNLATNYVDLDNFSQATQCLQQALELARSLGTKGLESTILNNLADAAVGRGDLDGAVKLQQQALDLSQATGSLSQQATNRAGLASIYSVKAEYAKVMEQYNQALALYRQTGERKDEAEVLNSIGDFYNTIGQYSQALEYYNQALKISADIHAPSLEASIQASIGNLFLYQKRYSEATPYYQQALTIYQTLGDRTGAGFVLQRLSVVYREQQQYDQAENVVQQAIQNARDVEFPILEATALQSLGNLQTATKHYSEAQVSLQQALIIATTIAAPQRQAGIWASLGKLAAQQNQPELAIVLYKQSINQFEAIRGGLHSLTKEQQQSYSDTVAETYRQLADLLLQQNRVLEAQRVLDLLKVQELDNYLRDVRGNDNSRQGVSEYPQEAQFRQGLDTILNDAVQMGQELTELQQIAVQNRTPQQQQHIIELRQRLQQVSQQFSGFLNSDDVQAKLAELRQSTEGQTYDLSSYKALQDNLQKLPNAVLLYPLVLPDRLELVLVTPGTAIHRTVNIKSADLNQQILDFRQALQDPGSDAKTPAQRLYQTLIQPIEADLQQVHAKTIVYAPDGALRYIPLEALYDGQQWLVQRYGINNITAASLTDFNIAPHRNPSVFAGAFTNGSYPLLVGTRREVFTGLPFAGREVDALAALIPQTIKRLNQAFNPATVHEMNDYNIVHLATHAAFIPGNSNASFIVFGNGQIATLPEVQNWPLNNVDLVVLSACETAVGDELGDGREILGLGYQFQAVGARATIASLWSVSDGGTQVLMDAFYAGLVKGMSKVEALQQAQIALITGNTSAIGTIRGDASIDAISTRSGLPSTVSDRLNHPYYWAPFILIGNGL